MGSSSNHTIGRSIFYPQTNGILNHYNYIISNNSYILIGLILVHDLTNKKSYNNLKTWLSEFYDGIIIVCF